jgi:hypothetical protein
VENENFLFSLRRFAKKKIEGKKMKKMSIAKLIANGLIKIECSEGRKNIFTIFFIENFHLLFILSFVILQLRPCF